MSGFGIFVVCPPKVEGRLDQMVREADTLDDVLGLVREVEAGFPGWRAITIVHREDLPLMLEGGYPTPPGE